MVHLQQNGRLNKLGVDQGRNHGNNGFVGVHNGPLRKGVHIPFKPKFRQIFQEFFSKQPLTAQIFNVLPVKMQILNIFHDLFQAAEDGKTAIVRILSIEYVKSYFCILILIPKIAVAHGHFIKSITMDKFLS